MSLEIKSPKFNLCNDIVACLWERVDMPIIYRVITLEIIAKF
jgi:hypothetical protein